jgi:hypothetical protein
MLVDPVFVKSDFDTVTDEMYETFLKDNCQSDFSRQGWYRPLQRRFADMKIKELKEKSNEALLALCSLIGEKQFSLTAGQNAWILKPGGKSRGRGIEIHTDMNDLLKSIMISRDTIWVV